MKPILRTTGVLGVSAAGATALAQVYPSVQLTLGVAFAAGSGANSGARIDVQEQLAHPAFEVWPSRNPQELDKHVADQLAHWTSPIRQANIRPE